MRQAFDEMEEIEILRLAKKDDLEAAEYLLNKYNPLVKKEARAYFLIGGDTEDLIQEGMIGLLHALYNYDEKKNNSFGPFARLCIDRRIQTAVEAANRLKNTPLNESISLHEEMNKGGTLEEQIPAGNDSDPVSIVLGKERMEQLFEMVEKNLSDMEKKVLKEYLDGYSYQTIGEHLGKSSKAIDNAVQRIRKKLKIVD